MFVYFRLQTIVGCHIAGQKGTPSEMCCRHTTKRTQIFQISIGFVSSGWLDIQSPGALARSKLLLPLGKYLLLRNSFLFSFISYLLSTATLSQWKEKIVSCSNGAKREAYVSRFHEHRSSLGLGGFCLVCYVAMHRFPCCFPIASTRLGTNNGGGTMRERKTTHR